MEGDGEKQVRELLAQGMVREAEKMLDEVGKEKKERDMEGSVGGVCKGWGGDGWEAGVFQGRLGGGP